MHLAGCQHMLSVAADDFTLPMVISSSSHYAHFCMALRLHYMPHQQWLELWLSAAGATLPRCQPQHLTTFSLVLGTWGVLPLQGFNVEFWRTTRARWAGHQHSG